MTNAEIKKIRKGVKVRYIGKDEIAQGMEFTVHQKFYTWILVSWPTRYLDGSIHYSRCNVSINDFELV